MTCQVGSVSLSQRSLSSLEHQPSRLDDDPEKYHRRLILDTYLAARLYSSTATMNAKVYLVVAAALAFIGPCVASDADGCLDLQCAACDAANDCQWLNCPSPVVASCYNVTLLEANNTCSNTSCSAGPSSTTQIATTVAPPTTPNPSTSVVTTFSSSSSSTAGNSTNTTTSIAPTPALNVTTVATTTATTTTTTTAASTNSSGSTTTGTPAPPTSSTAPHRNSTFDAASFIGGIVLVLGLQAVIFFLYKFCKSKERNYHTL
ncbi:sialomucin core protein 24 isoform X2 [Syngnathus acus]|uniref:sialomucin core protein 24 isoform X2 n=1 Tax=Syngnathus acus TaxID=161584 RepID=UPI00188646DC|nr:sialomucin core protein 24 isoform X2 [Syngnathus acus]